MSHSRLQPIFPAPPLEGPRSSRRTARRVALAGMWSALCIVAGAGLPAASHAALSIAAIQGGSPQGGNARENFDALTLGSVSQLTATGVTVNFSGGAAAVAGSLAGVYTAPFLSGSNGTGFGTGGTDQTLGANATAFLSTTAAINGGFGAVELLLPVESSYLGLLWGSIGADDTLELFDGLTLVGTLTGSSVTANPDGSAGESGTRYVNITSTLAFDRIVASNRTGAFEFDNLALDVGPNVVPLPGTLWLAGLGLLGLTLTRRARADANAGGQPAVPMQGRG